MERSGENLIDGRYSITDLVDLDSLRDLFEKFTLATGFTIGFLDHPGMNILITSGWRDICVKFHRGNPVSNAICLESNRHLLDQLKEPGQIVIERCGNGLVDCATPIIIKGKHIASLATGQFLLEEPDPEFFRARAKCCGFDEKAYLDALSEIRVFSEEKVRSATEFLGSLASMISDLGYTRLETVEKNARLEKEVRERMEAEAALRKSEDMLKTSLAEKDTLLRELYHRTKNSMHIVGTMLEMQSLKAPDITTKKVLLDINGKIQSMALAHEKLYEAGNLTRIDLGDYLASVADMCLKRHSADNGGISISLNAKSLFVPVDIAIPCGLIVNELAVNSIEHAFVERDGGRISIRAERLADNFIELEVSDDGPGPGKAFDPAKDAGMGIRTVISIGELQLLGKVSFRTDGNFACLVRFRSDLYGERI